VNENGGAKPIPASEPCTTQSDRRCFIRKASIASAASVLGAGALLRAPLIRADRFNDKPRKGDIDILVAAEIAEALAVTTYSNIINSAPFFLHIPGDDQDYLKGALQEEMSHYLLEHSVTSQPTPFTTFYYPENMFQDAQTTLNTLVLLEDAFIAAYLVGVRDFSNDDLKVTAARIMGIESDHRTLARVVAGDVAPQDGGPLLNTTGSAGIPESVDPPNNNGYERTLCWTSIDQAVAALTPFVDKAAARKAGFNTKRPFAFEPFTPTLHSALGAFGSFAGNGC
jgi:hypothetical protein